MHTKPAYAYKADLIRVIDGDTVEVLLDLGCSVHRKEIIRLYGIDAAELRGSRKKIGKTMKEEREYAKKAESFVHWHMSRADELVINTIKDRTGKYGRLLGIIYCDGESLNDKLLDRGLVIECG